MGDSNPTRPSRSTTTRSDTAMTSGILCETKMTPMSRSAASWRTRASTASTLCSSIEVVGSSSATIFAPNANALAIVRAWRWAGLNRDSGVRRLSGKPIAATSASAPSIASAAARRCTAVLPSRRFCSTVSWGTMAGSWCAIITPSASAWRGEYSPRRTPSTLTEPLSGARDPPRMPSRVLLPAPFSPASVRTSPCRSVKLTLSSARTPGNDFATLLISRRAAVIGGCPYSSRAGVPLTASRRCSSRRCSCRR